MAVNLPEPEPNNSSDGGFCSTCGLSLPCGHESPKPTRYCPNCCQTGAGYDWICPTHKISGEIRSVHMAFGLPDMESGYDLECKSYDHKLPRLQMQAINFAMKYYFGGTTGILAQDWLSERNKQFPRLYR